MPSLKNVQIDWNLVNFPFPRCINRISPSVCKIRNSMKKKNRHFRSTLVYNVCFRNMFLLFRSCVLFFTSSRTNSLLSLNTQGSTPNPCFRTLLTLASIQTLLCTYKLSMLSRKVYPNSRALKNCHKH